MEIMSMLDGKGMNKLRADFEKQPQGLTLDEFVRRIILRLPDTGISDIELVARLQDLFHQVDVNGDKHMDWEEFSNFCVEAGVAASNMSAMEITEKYVQRPFVDAFSHTSEIRCIKFVEDLGRMFVCEADSHTVKVYDPLRPDLALLHEIDLAEAVADQSDKRNIGTVLAVEYLVIGSRKLLAVSATNMTITLWDVGIYDVASNAIPRFVERVIVDKPLFILTYVPFLESLFTAAAESKMTVHSVRHLPQLEVKEVCTLRRHTDIVQDILSIDELELVVTAAMDAKIYLWARDPTRPLDHQIYLRSHRSGHQKGVRSLAYADEGLLLSAAFDLVVLAWDITEISMRPIFQLVGHTAPLFGVRILPSKQHAVSLDTKGVFKTWDIRREGSIMDGERNVQTFTLGASLDAAGAKQDEETQFSPCVLEVITPSGTLFAAKNRLLIFETAQLQPEKFSPAACVYNPTSITIACAVHRDVKIWDARTAELLCHFQDITASDITSLKLDFRKRKFITADQKGKVTVFNYLNGSLMKDNALAPHENEISCMVYGPEDKIIISASWDKSIRIYDETLPNQLGPLRRILYAHTADIGALVLSHALSLFASADESGLIRIWDFQFLGLEGEMRIGSAVVALAFLEPYPLLISIDREGQIQFWVVRPFATRANLHRHTCAARFALDDCLGEDETVSRVEVAPPGWHGRGSAHYLYAATSQGRVLVADLGPTLASLAIDPISASQRADERENYNPYRKMQRIMENEMTPPEAIEMLQPGVRRARRVASWMAHEAGVSSIEILQDPDAVLTCGGDKAIRLWTRSGDPLGMLDANERKALQVKRTFKVWQFPIDMDSRRKRELADAQRVVDRILGDLAERKNTSVEELLPAPANPATSNEKKAQDRRRFTTILFSEEENAHRKALQEKRALQQRKRERSQRAAHARQLNFAASTAQLQIQDKDLESEALNVLDAVVEGDQDGISAAERERQRILGQLKGKRTWKKTQQEIAAEAAEAQARAREQKLKAFARKMTGKGAAGKKKRKRKKNRKQKKNSDQSDTKVKVSANERAERDLPQGTDEDVDVQREQPAKSRKRPNKKKNKKNENSSGGGLAPGAKQPTVGAVDPSAAQAAQSQSGKLHLYDNLRAELQRAEMKDQKALQLNSAKRRNGKLTLEPPSMVKKCIDELNFAAKVNKRHAMSAPLLRGVGQGAELPERKEPHDTQEDNMETEGRSQHVNNNKKDDSKADESDPMASGTMSDDDIRANKAALASLLDGNGAGGGGNDGGAREQDEESKASRRQREEDAAARLEQARLRLEKRKTIIVTQMNEERQKRLEDFKRQETIVVQQRAVERKTMVQRALAPTKEQLKRIRQARYLGPFLKQDVAHIRDMFRSLDGDGNGAIDLREFQLEIKRTSSESGNFRSLLDQSVRMFRAIDVDRSGFIQLDELARVLFNKATAKEMDDILVFLHLPPARKRGKLSSTRTSSNARVSGSARPSSGGSFDPEADYGDAESDAASCEDEDGFDDIQTKLSKRKTTRAGTTGVKSTRSARAEIRALFDLYDTNNDNELTVRELEAAIHENGLLYSANDHHQMDRGLAQSDLADLVAALDVDANKTVSFDEFYSYFIDKWET
ncbi:WD repeat-containing protein wdr-5.1 [Hondaea fermentalgiana]|uniref:WD repeat-containing protein wdr-5.1 n=1 Tax=Hondaea fermentalgiana TaxID=2315210 RepID=A0A2R5GAZ6_9STRA|nr:WD repeat-containing protein wdr-5.1 [Hondaea fermentalgiana]|eukprot:GBG27765.1 WD repeat-containing protein wdr-5.1 [Hondaea fermentalgiana]